MDGNSSSRLPRLPPYIEDAWGLRDRPNKGPKRGLSVERIVDAAVAIADAEGLSAVSMSRIAADLGASTMSLYRYVASKDDLLHLMADVIYHAAPAPRQGEGWRSALSRWAWEQHQVLRRHSWVLKIPISGPPVMPNQIIWLERGLGCLHDTALTETEKLSVIMLLSGYTRNEATVAAEVEATFIAAAASEHEAMASYGLMVRKLTDPVKFPHFSAVIDAGVLEVPGGPDDEFTFGLDCVLDGIDALIRRRAEQRAGG